MTIPFISYNAIVFECQSGTLCVGDLVNAPMRYEIGVTGVCHIPASAIVLANGQGPEFSVDNGQVFFIDAPFFDAISEAIWEDGFIWPNRDLHIKLRELHQTHFGYVCPGDLYDTDLHGDGTFVLDVSLIREGLPEPEDLSRVDARELLRRSYSAMGTLSCASCRSNELESAPTIMVNVADHAISIGWTAIPKPGSFGDITPLCPKCNKARQQ